MILLTEGTRLFNLDFQLVTDSFLTIISVFVLFVAFSLLLFNPVRKMLNDRKDRIHNEIEGAHATKAEADELKAQYESKLKNIDKEADEILSDARRRALANESQIIAEAKEEAQRILAHARNEAELEKQKAVDDVKKEMIVLASMIAGKVVSASIDTTVQDKMVEETLKEMGKSTWQN